MKSTYSKRQNKSLMKYLYIGIFSLIIISSIVVVIYSQDKEPKKVTPILKREVAKKQPPKKLPKRNEKEEVKKVETPKNSSADQLKAIRDKYGDNIPENLKATVYFLENPPKIKYTPRRTKARIFKHPSERIIASILLVEPGAFMLRRPTYDSFFDNNLEVALKEKIEFLETDTEEDRRLKEAVIATKKELSEYIKKGEKASDVLNDVTENLFELSKYKKQIDDELMRIKLDSSYSDKDVEDFIKAANILLKEKGVKEIPMPNLVLRQFQLKRSTEQPKNK